MDAETEKRLADLEERMQFLEVIVLSGMEEGETDPIERQHREFAAMVRARRERERQETS